MRNEYFKENQYAELSIFSLLLTIYAKLGYYSIEKEQFPSRHPLMQKEYTKKFNEVLSYIDAHYADNLALDDMADFVGFSKFYFCRLFRQYTGLTFKDYLNFRRLKVAEELLADRTLSITDISQRAGFSNISTFNRLFKTARQCTPSDYRSKYAGNLFSK